MPREDSSAVTTRRNWPYLSKGFAAYRLCYILPNRLKNARPQNAEAVRHGAGVSRATDIKSKSRQDFRALGSKMKKRALVLAALCLALTSCVGVYGPKGNDTGGIIPWSPEAERNALNIAQANCSQFNKYAVITSVHRVYGDYIAYVCWWHPPRGRRYPY
jgi:hypothetical protein